LSVDPEIRYTSLTLEVQTVSPVIGFDAQEFTVLGVLIVADVPVPSIGTTDKPVVEVSHAPFGTYVFTFFPCTSTPSELLGWQDPGGGRAQSNVLGENLILIVSYFGFLGSTNVAFPVSV
jgi:hypothetical protein